MERTKLTRVLSAFLAFVMLFCCVAVSAATPGSTAGSATDVVNSALEILNDSKWAEYSAKYAGVKRYTGEPVVIKAADYSEFTYDETLLSEEDFALPFVKLSELDGVTDVLQTPDVGTVSWKVNVPETALYAIKIYYYPVDSKATDIERTVRINGTVPFNEVRNIKMTKNWVDVYSYDDDGNIVFETDGNQNDRRPSKVSAPEWKEYTVCDPTGYYSYDYWFYLEAGENTLSFDAQKEPVTLSSISLCAPETQITYAEYLAAHRQAGHTAASETSVVRLEAEHESMTSDSTIYAITDRTSSITYPQHASYIKLNAVGGSNWETMGQWIEWEIDIPEDGMYTINARYLQSTLSGLFSSRRLRIDGEVPFAEANMLEFMYNRNWCVSPFTSNGQDFEFYFTKGTHKFSLEVTFGRFGEIVAGIRDVLSNINNIYIKILQITGTAPDASTSYNFYQRIPNEIEQMRELSQKLYDYAEQFVEVSGVSSSNTAVLENIARVLEKMARDSENNIAKNFDGLKSYIGNLGTWINGIQQQTLTVDYFVIQPAENKLPKANGNFFENFWFEMSAFVYSFIRDNSSFASVGNTGDKVVKLEVWTTVSREYAQIIRTLVDDSFAKEFSNISANLKLVVEATLLPATLAGVGPDLMMGVSQSNVINYALRGAVTDISDYNGFSDLYYRFHNSAWTPMMVSVGSPDGKVAVFGVPQTQSFNVMFYRKDVFAQLGITVPTTWDEFHAIVPKLQSKNYLVGMSKDLTMFIYQNGGELYTNNGLTVSYDQKISLDAFQQMCDFFNLYRFPLTYDAANRFRTGEMPLLMADYISFYNQFTIFATELKGLWGFASIPGTVQADGSVNNSITSTISAMVIMKDAIERGTNEAAFNFMEWWMRTDIQGRYATELVGLLGPAGKYPTANQDAFNSMPWTAEELRMLKIQFANLKGVPEMPGSYILARYVDFAFNDAYNNDADPDEELLGYVPLINAEMERKREELTYDFYLPPKNYRP